MAIVAQSFLLILARSQKTFAVDRVALLSRAMQLECLDRGLCFVTLRKRA